ncbi:MAG: ribonuclease Z [bacterium]
MEVILLGTSAALPTRLRWPSATALIREGEVLLFDCGEGAQIQFQKARLKPGKLTRIFISHFHGDHFYGLPGLLTSLQLGGREKKLYLYGPKGIAEYIRFMQKLSHFTLNYEIEIAEVPAARQQNVWKLDEYKVVAMPLKHRIFTLGFRFEEKPKPGKFDAIQAKRLKIPWGPVRNLLKSGQQVQLPDGRKITPSQVVGPKQAGKIVVFCTDTRPCANAVKLARNADLLIHEGTFAGARQKWADSTGHSTVLEAAGIAQKAGVKALVLTHISARYEERDFNPLLNEAQKVFPNTSLGYDFMKIHV